MASFENLHLFLQCLMQRRTQDDEEKHNRLTNNNTSHYEVKNRILIQEENNVELSYLFQFMSRFNSSLWIQKSSQDIIRSDTIIDYKQQELLDTILTILQQLSSGDSFSLRQDIYTIAYYTYHLLLNHVIWKKWEQCFDGSSMECHTELFTKGSRKRKRLVSGLGSDVSIKKEVNSSPIRNQSKVDSNSKVQEFQLQLCNILHLIIESLTFLREKLYQPIIHSSRRSLSTDEIQTNKDEFITCEEPYMENIENCITEYYFADDTPIHHYSHLATILCRLAIPQSPNILLQLARNGTLATSYLIRGCIKALLEDSCCQETTNDGGKNFSVQKVVKDSLQHLANELPCERMQIISILRQKRIMPDILLTLLLQQENDMQLFHILLSELLNSTVGQESDFIIRNLKYPFDNDTTTIHSILIRLTNHLLSYTTKPYNKIPWGEASLSIHTITLLIIISEVKLDVLEMIVARAINSLLDMITVFSSTNPFNVMGDLFLYDTIPSNSAVDNFLRLSFCTCIILCMACFSSLSKHSLKSSSGQELFNRILLQMKRVSKKATIFAVDVLKMLNDGQQEEFQHLLRNVLSYPQIYLIADTFSAFCKWARFLLHPTGEPQDPKTMNVIKSTLLQSILNDPQQCEEFIYGRHILSSKYCILDLRALNSGMAIPLVTPYQLEGQEKALGLNIPCSDIFQLNMKEYHCQYTLHVLYYLLALERSPLSPFATIVPRDLSLSNIVSLADEASRSSHHIEIEIVIALLHLIAKHCPDLVSSWKALQLSVHRVYETFHGSQSLMATLESSILHSLSNRCTYDENSFIICRAFRPSLELKVVKTMLESIEKRCLFLSYNALVEDPIQIFKAPLASWLRSRNVLVSIVQRLFITHSALSMKRCPFVDVAIELLLARDAIALKCFITLLKQLNKIEYSGMVVSSGHDRSSYSKSLTDQDVLSNFVRSLIAQRRGLFTYIYLESIPFHLIAFGPECVLEFMILSNAELGIAVRLSLAEMSLKISTTVTFPGLREALSQSVLGFIASLTFHTESGRTAHHYSTALRILSYMESLPLTSVEMVGIVNEAKSVLGKMQGNHYLEATSGLGFRRKVV